VALGAVDGEADGDGILVSPAAGAALGTFVFSIRPILGCSAVFSCFLNSFSAFR